MLRRSFLQSVIGGVTALFVRPAKSDIITEKSKEITQPIDKQRRYKCYSCFFKGYRIVAAYNRVQWIRCESITIPKEGIPKEGLTLGGRVDLETHDVCEGLYFSKASYLTGDCVLWWGERELWKIEYIAGEMVFQVINIIKDRTDMRSRKEDFIEFIKN